MSYVKALGSTQSRPMSRVRVAMGDSYFVQYDANGWINRSGVSSATPDEVLKTLTGNSKVFEKQADFFAAIAANEARAQQSGVTLPAVEIVNVDSPGMSTGAKLAIGAGALGALYFLTRKS